MPPNRHAWQKIILHADMDAFYAAVEQLDHPELRGKPLLIGHPGMRGVVSTASYEARPYGVGSAMPMAQARRLCPEAIVVPPRMGRYSAVSKQVMEVFGTFSPVVEPLSLDEAFLDMTGSTGLFGEPADMGRKLREAVKEATGGLTVSVGIAPTKYVAKVASDFDKPDGLTVVPADRVLEFLHPLPVARLWGVGKKGQVRLAELGLDTIADVAAASAEWLCEELGQLGAHIKSLSMGEDPRRVVPDHDAKSIGSEVTLEHDVRGEAAIRPHLLRSAQIIARRLRGEEFLATGIRVKLKTKDFQLRTRQAHLERGTDNADDLFEAALALLPRFDLEADYRLVGLAAFAMHDACGPVQGSLFGAEERERQRRLDSALDRVQDRFGPSAVRRGTNLDR